MSAYTYPRSFLTAFEDSRILAAEVKRLHEVIADQAEDLRGVSQRLADCRKGITRWPKAPDFPDPAKPAERRGAIG